jgi:tetratricopeptide (TPR) repeat protein
MAAPQALLCADASCCAPLRPPLLQCAKCKAAAYCSKECQIRHWKAGHKRDCGQGAAATAARRVLQVQVQAAQQAQHPSRSSARPVMTNRQKRVCNKIDELAQARNWRGLAAMEPEARSVADELRVAQPAVVALIYGNLGICYRSLGQYAKAIKLYEQERKISEVVGHRAGQGRASSGIGNCYHSLGQFDKAIEQHKQHRAIAEELGDRAGQGSACSGLGSCYRSLGQYTKAVELHEQDRAIAEEVGDRAGQGRACGNLGVCYHSLEQYEKAITLHEQSLMIREELGDPHSLMQASRGLGMSLTRLGCYAQALKHHKQQWALSEQVGNASHQATAALNIGVTLWTQGLAEHQAIAAADGSLQMQTQNAERLDEARQWLTTALDRNTVAPIIATELDATLSLSCLTFFTSQEAEALKYLHAHLDLCVKHARDACAGCWQRRGEDTPMSTCSGCKVARSVLHLRISSLNHNTYLAYNCYSYKRM